MVLRLFTFRSLQTTNVRNYRVPAREMIFPGNIFFHGKYFVHQDPTRKLASTLVTIFSVQTKSLTTQELPLRSTAYNFRCIGFRVVNLKVVNWGKKLFPTLSSLSIAGNLLGDFHWYPIQLQHLLKGLFHSIGGH